MQKILDEVVLLAIKHRLVAGRVLIHESTRLKTYPNNQEFVKKQDIQSTKA